MQARSSLILFSLFIILCLSLIHIYNRMLRARILKLQGNEGCKEEQAAFQLLRDGLLEAVAGKKNYPKPVSYTHLLSEVMRNCRITRKAVRLSPYRRQHLPWQDFPHYLRQNLMRHWKSI